MIFKLKADAEFDVDSDDLDDAFGELEAHFRCLSLGDESPLQLVGGSIEILPVSENQE